MIRSLFAPGSFNPEVFRTTSCTIMFSSDVSARGMDYPDVTTSVQVGLPSDKAQSVPAVKDSISTCARNVSRFQRFSPTCKGYVSSVSKLIFAIKY